MFGKRNVRRAFTSRYLSFKVRWTREGGGGVAGAARLCHGRSRGDRHEPVSVEIHIPAETSAAQKVMQRPAANSAQLAFWEKNCAKDC